MKENLKQYKIILSLGLLAIPLGILIGMVDAVFGNLLLKITSIRDLNPVMYLPFLPIAGVFIVYNYIMYGKDSIKGMSLVFEAGHSNEENIPPILIPFVIIGTWASHLFGASVGREGVAVQIGAAMSNLVEKKLKIKDKSRILLITGMASGFSGLFQTPIAAVMFALEVLVAGKMKYEALFPAIVGSFTAAFTSNYFGLGKFQKIIDMRFNLNLALILKLMALGLIFSIVGGSFAIVLKKTKTKFENLVENPIKRVFVIGIILSIILILLHKGRYSGLGTNLIDMSLNKREIYFYDWILKYILTILCLSAGFQGGEVTPLFSIGASLGAVIAPFFNLPVEIAASLGYAAVFSSATNTFLAPIFIGLEVFGYSNLPYFFIVCSISYIFNMNKSIYTKQKIQTN